MIRKPCIAQLEGRISKTAAPAATVKLGPLGGDFSQQRLHGIGGQFRAVQRGRREPAEGVRKRLRRERERFGDAASFDARGEVKNVTADWVADFDAGVRAGKFAGVARIAKVVDYGVAEHQREYGKPVRCAQRRSGEARLQDAARNGCATWLLFRMATFSAASISCRCRQ